MIKAAMNVNGKATLLLGLSIANRDRLGIDMPIHITREMLAEMELPDDMEILLFGGDTEESMIEDLARHGFIAR